MSGRAATPRPSFTPRIHTVNLYIHVRILCRKPFSDRSVITVNTHAESMTDDSSSSSSHARMRRNKDVDAVT